MKITITLIDTGNGQVEMKSQPPIQDLLHQWKAGNQNPALAYAIAALKKMHDFSEEIQKDLDRDRRTQEMMNSPILFDPRLKKERQVGPTEVN